MRTKRASEHSVLIPFFVIVSQRRHKMYMNSDKRHKIYGEWALSESITLAQNYTAPQKCWSEKLKDMCLGVFLEILQYSVPFSM